MDMNSVWTLSGAQSRLKQISSDTDILEKIKETIYSWQYKSEYDLDSIRNDLNDIVEDVVKHQFQDEICKETRKSVCCVVYNDIYENLVPLIRGQFSKEDLYLYEKCSNLCKRNVSAGQLGSSVYNCLPFVTPVVELSVLDTYKSPLEKVNCLCSTYDLIFAELKLALVSIISKYSEKECEIPVINNEEVIPILMLVVIKSKLLYLWSNLFYIKFFAIDIIEENSHVKCILDSYEKAVQRILAVDEASLNPSCDNNPTNLDVAATMKILYSDENDDKKDTATIKEEGKRRLVSLIITSVEEKDFIPLDTPKIFT